MPLSVDLTDVPMNVRRRMKEVLADEFAAQAVQAKIRQRKVAKFYHDNQPRAIEGIGGLRMAVDPFWVGYFSAQEGPQIWEDADFVRWFLKEGEEFRVRSSGTKLMVGYAPNSSSFRKKYA